MKVQSILLLTVVLAWRQEPAADSAAKTFELAIESVGKIQEAWDRPSILGTIAATQARVGFREEARRTLALAQELYKSLKKDDRWIVAESLAKAHAELAEFETAFRILDEHPDPAIDMRHETLNEIARLQVRAGKKVEAGQTIERILEKVRVRAPQFSFSSIATNIAVVARDQTILGLRTGGRATFSEAIARARRDSKDAKELAGQLEDIARQQLFADLKLEARATLADAAKLAKTGSDPYERATSLYLIGFQQIEAGDQRAALQNLRIAAAAAEQIPKTPNQAYDERSNWMESVAVALAKAGDYSGGVELARRIPGRAKRSEAFLRIGAELTAARKPQRAVSVLESAVETARTAVPAATKVSELSEIAAEFSLAGSKARAEELYAEAVILMRQKVEDESKARAMLAIGKAQIRGDLKADARETLLVALRFALRFNADDNTERFPRRESEIAGFQRTVFEEIASAQIDAGDLDGAMATARIIVDSLDRAQIVTQIIEAHVKRGRIPEALGLVSMLTEPESRVFAYLSIAEKQAELERKEAKL